MTESVKEIILKLQGLLSRRKTLLEDYRQMNKGAIFNEKFKILEDQANHYQRKLETLGTEQIVEVKVLREVEYDDITMTVNYKIYFTGVSELDAVMLTEARGDTIKILGTRVIAAGKFIKSRKQ